VTAGVCDYNCCCDPDCSGTQKSRFAAVGCLAEGYSPNKTQFCYSSLELYKVNPKLPLGGQPTAEASVGGALCVQKYNGATEIEYFTDTAVQSSAVFSVAAGKKPYTYGEDAPASMSLDANYDRGDNIAAYAGPNATPGSLHAATMGFFSIPAADFNGKCNDFNYATFENDIPARSCSRQMYSADGSALFVPQCEKDFSVSRYVTELWIGTVATARDTAAASVTAVTAVQLTSVKYQNPVTNALTDVTTDYKANTCTTAYRADKAAYLASATAGAAGTSCQFNTAAAADITNVPRCQNMVTSVVYTVEHSSDAAGTITAVKAAVVITDVTRDVSAVSLSVTQTFGVDFVATAVAGTTSNTSGNQVKRVRSGNPGYLMGRPVLIGTLAAPVAPASLGTIAEVEEGLQVVSSLMPYDSTAAASFGTAKCPTSLASAHQTVGFGYDMTSGCELELTRAQLKDLCCTNSDECNPVAPTAYADPTSGIPYFLAFPAAAQYVGLYGNADPLDVKQWTVVSQRATTLKNSWNDNTGICKNMVTGLHYKFLVASTGEKSFPQSKIVAAEVEHITSEWRSNVPYTDAASTQTFPLEVIVSFIHKDASDIAGYVPPAPPVLVQVPHDVFYPFFMSPASSKASISMVSVLAPLLCTMALVGAGFSL